MKKIKKIVECSVSATTVKTALDAVPESCWANEEHITNICVKRGDSQGIHWWGFDVTIVSEQVNE